MDKRASGRPLRAGTIAAGESKGPVAQTDPTRNPNGVYSGMTKRLALSDGTFADVGNMPGDTRKSGVLKHDDPSINDLSRGRLS
jgi:hypothetical protein